MEKNQIGGATTARINEKKNINVQEALNGFVINLGYGELHIAANVDEALKIIGDYLNRPKVGAGENAG